METISNQVAITTQEELAIIKAKEEAAFALTPVGQYQKEFETLQRQAKMYAQSTIVPATYAGNVGNCAIALDMAKRLCAMPLTVMQNLYIVHGMPAFSTKFLVACINASKRFSPLRYEFRDEDTACRCYAYEKSDREHTDPLYGDWITMEMADAEGWSKKNGSKWKTMPTQMLRYRAAAFWCRVYCPEISMGLMTREELNDIDQQELQDIAATPASRKQAAREKMLRAALEETEETDEADYEQIADDLFNVSNNEQ